MQMKKLTQETKESIREIVQSNIEEIEDLINSRLIKLLKDAHVHWTSGDDKDTDVLMYARDIFYFG